MYYRGVEVTIMAKKICKKLSFKLGKKYDWKKTAQKGAQMAAYVFVAGLLSAQFQNEWFLAAAPLLKMAENFLRNYKK